MPDFLLRGFRYPETSMSPMGLTDRMVAKGWRSHRSVTADAAHPKGAHRLEQPARSERNYRVRPGNRCWPSANNPAMVACWLAATRPAVVVSFHANAAGRRACQRSSTRPGGDDPHLCDTRLMDGETVWLAPGQPLHRTGRRLRRHRQPTRGLDRIALSKSSWVRGGEHRPRRRGVAGLHLRAAPGSPRPQRAFHQDLLPPTVVRRSIGRHTGRRVRGLPAARLHPAWARHLPASVRPPPARGCLAAKMIDIIRSLSRHHLAASPPRPPIAPCWRHEGSADISSLRLRHCPPVRPLPARCSRLDAQRLAGRFSARDRCEPRCCTSSSPTRLDDLARPAHRSPVAGYEAQDRRRRRLEGTLPRGTVGRLADHAARRTAATSPTRASVNTCATAGTLEKAFASSKTKPAPFHRAPPAFRAT